VVSLVSGQLEKHRCLPNNTKPKVEVIKTNGFKEITEVFKEMDKTKVAN